MLPIMINKIDLISASLNYFFLCNVITTGLECLERWCNGDVWQQHVTYSDGCQDEQVPMCEHDWRWQMVLELVTSCVPHVWVKIHYSWDISAAVMYSVHHHCSCVAPSLFQAGSSKRLQHGCDAQVPAVLPGDKTDCSSLDQLKLVDVVFGQVWLCMHIPW